LRAASAAPAGQRRSDQTPPAVETTIAAEISRTPIGSLLSG
jgi:hypothetical protein